MEIIHISQNSKITVLRQKRSAESNNVLQEANSVKKCLFGIPDPKDVENLLNDQIQEDWQRIKDKFGIAVEDIENMENIRQNANTPKKRKVEPKSRKIVNSKRRKLFSQYDRKITAVKRHKILLEPSCELYYIKECYLIFISVLFTT
ncbi:hypothetical protein BDFB_002307 [Asbolus verrucosus]|uniref:Uncharacterized protein n=1 Tax=Asbolus verrucosus TaxID=1661398 RepID=A0A482V9Z4_ASBVE|nr:hypothetical protein BDFB_002307 [Asbolus verrucosus]